MKSAVVFLLLLFCCQQLYAADYVQKTEKGLFNLVMTVKGNTLKNGTNELELVVRDRNGKAVEGGELTITPWLPAMGQGVWDKPVVTERGGGKYHLQNIVTTMNGRWELKVDVKKGTQTDRTVFPFDVSGTKDSRKEIPLPKGKFARSTHSYNAPKVTLLNQDGKKINFKEFVDSGKPVIIDFIYTTCTTICPVLSVSFTNLRKELGADADKIQLISISIDPDHDRPEQMKKYLARYKAGKGWDFLTGSREDINRVLKALDATVIDKMAHEAVYIMKGPHSDDWVRIKGLLNKGDLLDELRRLEQK